MITAEQLSSFTCLILGRRCRGRSQATHLVRAGYTILARNFRTRYGELDLIAADARCIVFFEVNRSLRAASC